MAVNLMVHADVVDIKADTPRPTDSFFVDSNVWLRMVYPNASHNEPAWRAGIMSKYANYVSTLGSVGAQLHWCGLSLAELSHVIELTEKEIYEATHGRIRSKEYRHTLPAERTNVVKLVDAAWGQVKSLAEPISATVSEATTDAAMARFRSQQLDGYDLFILEAMAANGVTQIITDDGDFATVPGIQVFTSNPNSIKMASAQGRLISR